MHLRVALEGQGVRFAKLAQVGRLRPTRVWRLSEVEWAGVQDRLSSAVAAAPGGPGVAPEDEEWGAALLEDASALFVAADQAAPVDSERPVLTLFSKARNSDRG